MVSEQWRTPPYRHHVTVAPVTRTLRIGLYARISDAEDTNGVERQIAQLRRTTVPTHYWLDRFDLTAEIAGDYVDNNVSAYDPKRTRPEWTRLLDDLSTGRLDAVAAYALDRLFRQPYDFELLLRAMQVGGANYILTDTNDNMDLASGEGVLNARLQAAIANEETRKTKGRITLFHNHAAEAGKPSGGPRRFGYDVDQMVVREDEAAIVREMARRVIAGESLHSLAMELNARGVRPAGVSASERSNLQRAKDGLEAEPSTPSRWVNANLRRVLSAPYLAGIRVHRQTTYDAQWPAILDRTTHEVVRAALLNPARGTGPKGAGDRYELTGLMRCGRCGSKMYRVPVMEAPSDKRAIARTGAKVTVAHRGATTWMCHRTNGGCGRVARRPDPTEGWIIAEVVHQLSDPDFVAGLQQASPGLIERAEVMLALREATALREEAQVAYYAPAPGTPRLPRHVYERIDADHGQRVGALEGKLSSLSAAAGVDLSHLTEPGPLLERWEGIEVPARRALLRLVVECVRVLPAGKGVRVGREHYEVVYVR